MFSLTIDICIVTKKISYEDMIDYHSYAHNLCSCELEAWIKIRPEQDLNPWPLTMEGEETQVNIWNFIYLNCGEWYGDVIDHCSYAHSLNSCEIKAWKKSGLTGKWTHDLYLWKVKNTSEYIKFHIFELRRMIWRCDWSLQLRTQPKQLWN